MRNKTFFGAFLFVLGYFFISIISGLSKYLHDQGFSAVELTFFNFLVVAILSIPWALKQGPKKAFKTNNLRLILVRGLLGFTCFLAYFAATHKIPLVNAATFLNTAPLWVPICAMLILKERVTKKTLIFVFTGFLGMLLVLHPHLKDMNVEGDLYGLFSGFALAFILIIMRHLRNEPWQRVVLYYSIISTILSAIFVIPLFVMPEAGQLVYLLVMGLCMYFVQYLVTIALHYAKASTLSPLIYSSIIFSGIIGWAIWKHVPTPISLTGMFIIVASGILVLWVESHIPQEIE